MPDPPVVVVSVNVGGGLKTAVAVIGPLMTMLHGLGPVQAPVQPPNVEPPVAVALSVTGVPAGYVAVQGAVQDEAAHRARPGAGERSRSAGRSAGAAVWKRAVTERAWSIVTWQVGVAARAVAAPAREDRRGAGRRRGRA